jgi:hypothetical protein
MTSSSGGVMNGNRNGNDQIRGESFKHKNESPGDLNLSLNSSNHHELVGNNRNDHGGNFQKELNSVLHSKLPISKDKMNSIVKEAIKTIRHYKHVVYYVEIFIKNCPQSFKIVGLYVIDAIIRHARQHTKEHELFSNRFAKNMCKTFTHLYTQCLPTDRDKITRIVNLWQKYQIFDSELIDKLQRIASTSKIDSVLTASSSSSTSINNNEETLLNETQIIKRIDHLKDKLKKENDNPKIKSELNRLNKRLVEFNNLKKVI